MRVPPSDQMLDALMASAKIALQLSLREGFEVKVSEALHAGKPVVASNTGGIPLQIQHGKSGYLTEVGDNDAVAKHLFDLYTDDKLYKQMSDFARKNVSDEVGTVGNAAAWMYLAVSGLLLAALPRSDPSSAHVCLTRPEAQAKWCLDQRPAARGDGRAVRRGRASSAAQCPAAASVVGVPCIVNVVLSSSLWCRSRYISNPVSCCH
jgi:hypothetical protein